MVPIIIEAGAATPATGAVDSKKRKGRKRGGISSPWVSTLGPLIHCRPKHHMDVGREVRVISSFCCKTREIIIPKQRILETE